MLHASSWCQLNSFMNLVKYITFEKKTLWAFFEILNKELEISDFLSIMFVFQKLWAFG